jgi:hypothetical protein
MDTASIVMLLIGAVFLWGGVAASVTNYVHHSRHDTRTFDHG